MAIRAEFTIFPFREGDDLPDHVQAGIDAARALGIDVDVGAMSNTLSGDPDVALRALLAMQTAAVGAGATRIIVNLEVEDRAVPDVEFVQALAQALGPSYRVSLLDNDGAIQAMFGTVSDDAPARSVIPFTRSSGALVLERDRDGIGNGPGAVRDDPRALVTPSFTRVDQALTELIAECESEIGRPLEEMT
ncbi:MAG TPA: thiamine-binding protein, partial [Ilumatobacter sp.]